MPTQDPTATRREIRLTRHAALLVLVGACASPRDVDVPNDNLPDAGQTFADLALAWTEGGQLVTCGDLPGCPPAGSCTQHAAVGPPNAGEFVLEAGGTLEVGFLCSAFVERGGTTPDLHIHAVVPATATAVVAASLDGSTYHVLGELDAMTLDFDLARTDLTVARFVRITDTGTGGIRIDALEALR